MTEPGPPDGPADREPGAPTTEATEATEATEPSEREHGHEHSRGSHGHHGHHGHHGRSGRGRSRRRKHHHWYRPRNVVLGAIAAVVILVLGFALYLDYELSTIRRAPLLADYGGQHSLGENILLVGSEAPAHALALDQATMLVQLVHVSADAASAVMIDIPRDYYLPMAGGGGTTLGAAYRQDGDPAVVRAVQDGLGLTVDHVVQVGFVGYANVTDRLGGLDLPTPQGLRHFTGTQAVAFTDQFPVAGGTVTVGQRNQQWLKAMLNGTLTPSVLLDPFTIAGLLRDTTPSLVVDDSLTTGAIRGLLWHWRNLRPSGIHYLTVPYGSYGFRDLPGEGRQTVLLADPAQLRQLSSAVRQDDTAGILTFLG